MAVQAPVCLAMLICDAVHLDDATDKVTILGAFHRIQVTHFPSQHSRFMIYCELTGGRGRTDLTLKVIRVTPASPDSEILLRMTTFLEFRNPMNVERICFAVERAEFTEAGMYRFVLETDGAHFAERVLDVEA